MKAFFLGVVGLVLNSVSQAEQILNIPGGLSRQMQKQEVKAAPADPLKEMVGTSIRFNEDVELGASSILLPTWFRAPGTNNYEYFTSYEKKVSAGTWTKDFDTRKLKDPYCEFSVLGEDKELNGYKPKTIPKGTKLTVASVRWEHDVLVVDFVPHMQMRCSGKLRDAELGMRERSPFTIAELQKVFGESIQWSEEKGKAPTESAVSPAVSKYLTRVMEAAKKGSPLIGVAPVLNTLTSRFDDKSLIEIRKQLLSEFNHPSFAKNFEWLEDVSKLIRNINRRVPLDETSELLISEMIDKAGNGKEGYLMENLVPSLATGKTKKSIETLSRVTERKGGEWGSARQSAKGALLQRHSEVSKETLETIVDDLFSEKILFGYPFYAGEEKVILALGEIDSMIGKKAIPKLKKELEFLKQNPKYENKDLISVIENTLNKLEAR